MINSSPKTVDNRSITILPEDYAQVDSHRRKAQSRTFLIYASLLFLGGLLANTWWYYQDSRFLADGSNSTGTIDSWSTQASSYKGRSQPTHTINYQFKTQSGELKLGRDWVKAWRHRPKSESGIKPKRNQDILVEYLKADPNTSRIVIPNRYAEEHFLSTCAMLLGGALFLILLINSLPTKLRLQSYGGILILLGLALLTLFVYTVLLSDFEVNRPGDFLVKLLILLTFATPFVGGALWYGWFLFQQSHFTFTDPQELLKLESMPPCGDQVTIMPRTFMGTESAIVIDHQHRLVHFLNCHVAKGFLPKVKPIHSCNIDRLEFDEKTYSTKSGKKTQAILKTPEGSTSLGMDEPGVAELLGLLRKHR